MKEQQANTKMLTRQLFRLLPVQVLLAAVGSVNGIVSSFFATNFVGVDAMSAVGLYGPLNMMLSAISLMLVGGSVILCGKYMGQNRQDKLQNAFSLSLVLTGLIGLVFVGLYVLAALFDLTGILTRDPVVRPIFNRYLLGQAVGVLPQLLGGQLAAFLSMENRGRRTFAASLVYIAVNLVLNFLFVKVLALEAFGLAIASALGMWTFFAVQAQYYVFGRSQLRLKLRGLDWKESLTMVRIGMPGAANNSYQTARGLAVNWLLTAFVGSVGISAFAAANNLLAIFWALPDGMRAVSRMIFSVSMGEEDRQTLTDVMRVMFRRFLPLMCAVAALIVLCAEPLTRIFYRDPAEPVYMMTVWGLRILPLCMPLSVISMHFLCYWQASGRRRMQYLLSLLDGVICVVGFTALLIRSIGVNSVYVANVLNGVVSFLVILGFAWLKKKRFPRNMEELMALPDSFGAGEDERMDLSVKSIEDVVTVAREVQSFCEARGVDRRRAMLAGLAMEEMAGNIVQHGFGADRKSHSVDLRVVHKDGDVILRIKDDCRPFDPNERSEMAAGDDPIKNVGIRMVFRIARDVQYQNILGLNVLTLRI